MEQACPSEARASSTGGRAPSAASSGGLGWAHASNAPFLAAGLAGGSSWRSIVLTSTHQGARVVYFQKAYQGVCGSAMQ